MLIWYTGTSFSLTPFGSDFIDYVACTIPIQDITKVNNVIGIGMTLHKFTDTKGFQSIFLVFHITYHRQMLFILSPNLSPNAWWLFQGLWQDCIKMLLKTSEIKIQIVREKHNLPVVFDSYVSPKGNKTLASSMRSGLCHTQLNAFNFFQENTLHDL
jgi:hypothetical protein